MKSIYFLAVAFLLLPFSMNGQVGINGNGSTYGYYWTSTEQNATEAKRRIFQGNSNFQSDFINKLMGHSARCVKD